MAMGKRMSLVILFCSSLLLLLVSSSATNLKGCQLTSIYNFGDSLSDVGNAAIEFPDPHAWHYPLGMTIGKATGRFCDGLLVIDRIAEAAGLPYTAPYLNKSMDHSKGVNFAVGGTGILSKEERRKWNVTVQYSDSNLDVQLGWFRHFMEENFKNETLRRQHLESSLFVIGGGGNDYANLVWRNGVGYVKQKTLIMDDIMRELKGAVREFIRGGATKVVMTGVYQGGCLPNDNYTDNLIHCYGEANRYHILHNERLKKTVEELGKEFPHAHVAYGNIWGAAQWIFDRYASLGFKYPSRRCCGSDDGDKHNRLCGFDGVASCKHPEEHIFWDGVHFTDAAYRYMSHRIIPQISKALECDGSTPTAAAAAARSTTRQWRTLEMALFFALLSFSFM